MEGNSYLLCGVFLTVTLFWVYVRDLTASQIDRKSSNSAGRAALAQRQPAHARPGDAAKRCNNSSPLPGKLRPHHRPHCGGPHVARSGKDRRQEDQPRSRPPRAPQLDHVMRGTGQRQALRAAQRSQPRTQMQPHAQSPRQPPVSSHHEVLPPRAAQVSQISTQQRAVGVRVMAQHNAAQAARQQGDHRPRVCQPGRVGEQP